jgi:PKD repeat protein
MKKSLLTLGLATLFAAGSVFAQRTYSKINHSEIGPEVPAHRTCGSPIIEDDRFEQWMAQGIAEMQANGTLAQRALYNIPVVVHIIHNGGAVGSTYNIAAARVQTQIDVLNKDYSATNTDVGNIPSTFQNVKAGDCGIAFCLATKDPQGNALTEPGIHRVAASTISGLTWSNNGLSTSVIDQTVKPNTIWDVTKYFNIWVVPIQGGILGYATFPAGTGLTGLSGFGTTTTDGVVIGTTFFGTGSGTSAPFNKGRTATHEVGHWLGLRHISGDASCGNDFCSDTPPQKGGNSGGQGGLNYGCPTHPFQSGQCTGNTTGEMFMNYMDYVDDGCMVMFSANQKTRMVQTMTNGTYRKTLTASATNLCAGVTPVAPTADFSASPLQISTGGTVTFSDLTAGAPTSWTWSVSPSAGVAISNANAQNPTATFANVGSYSVTLTAANAQGNNTKTKSAYISVINASSAPCDTISNINDQDTLFAFAISGGTNTGYVAGNNTYDDVAKAEFFSAASLTGRKVTGALILFYRNGANGTKNGTGTGKVVVQYRPKSATAASPSATISATKDVTLASILAVTPINQIPFCGNQGIAYNSPLAYPVSVDFTNAVDITSDFFINVVLPTATGDTAVIMHNISSTSGNNTAWELWSNNTWYPFSDANSWGGPYSMAILPKTCPINTGFNSSSSVASKNVTLFPNPNSGVFKVITSFANTQQTKVTVTDLVGRVIETKTENGNLYMDLDLTKQAGGIYFVTVENGSEKVTERVNIVK